MAYLDQVYAVVQIAPTGIPTYVRLSQNENGRVLNFAVSGDALPAGSTVALTGTKPDGAVYSASGTLADNVATFNEDEQLTAVAGEWDAKVEVTNSGNLIATGRIKFVIDADPSGGNIPSDSQLDGYIAEMLSLLDAGKAEAYGSPLVASTVAGMIDQNKVYVYTGSETGYTAGNWYYWNGSAWTSGGVYNAVAVSTDTTLSIAGKAADAKATGDAIDALKDDLSDTSDAITKIGDDSYSKTLISYDGYDSNRSLTSGGKDVTTGSVILSFPVTAGAFIKVSLVNRTGGDILYFFQDQKTVPWDSNTHIIGDIHSGSSYTGYLYVPSGATYLVTNADMSNVVSTVESVDSSVLADLKNAIDDIEMLTFDTVHGKNLTYVDGTIYDSSDYELSDYIPVNAGDILYITAVLGGSSIDNYNGVCGYASDKSFVAGLLNQYTAIGLSGGRHFVEDSKLIIPDGISYIRGVSAYKDDGGYGIQSPFIVKRTNLESLDYRVANIEGDTSKNDPLIALSEYNSFLSGDASAATAYKKLFTLSAFTDLHGAKNQWNGFIEFTNQYKQYFDGAAFLGDICGQNPDSDISFYNPQQCQVPFLSVVGNHDAADWGKSISQSDIFNRYIKPCVDAGYISTTKSYYYKDFADYNIRVITLFEYENAIATTSPNSDNWRRYISTDQLQWFADTLYSTPADYSVIVLLHQVVFPQPTIVDNKFTENAIYRQVSADFTSGFGYILTNMGWSGDEIGDVVNAYIHGLSINKTYEAHMTNAGTVINVSVSKDFSARGAGKFVCYLAGHSHAPFVLKVKDYSDQVQILLPSASDNFYQRKADDIRPVSGSPNFYSLAFDTTNKLIKVLKVGHRTTMDMVERDFISIPY